MIQPGHIRIIDRKVYFEPDGLEKPNEDHYFEGKHLFFRNDTLQKDMEEYEASKQLIEVVNEIENIDGEDIHIWFKFKMGSSLFGMTNNQKCKAKVTGDTCTIFELTEKTNTNQICPHCGEDELGFDNGKLRCLCCKKFID